MSKIVLLCLFLVFLGLKLFDLVGLPWWVVTAPIWAPVVAAIVIFPFIESWEKL